MRWLHHTADSSPKSKQIDSLGAALPRGTGVEQMTSSPHHSRNQKLGSHVSHSMDMLATPPYLSPLEHPEQMPCLAEIVAALSLQGDAAITPHCAGLTVWSPMRMT